MDSILTLLTQRAPSFSKGQSRIARFILSDLQKAAMLTAGALGKETEVSESTVVRFATELGYDGYPQMQKAMQDALVERFSAAGTKEELPNLQKEELCAAAKILRSARRIYLIAQGKQKVLGEYLGACLENKFPDVHYLSVGSGKLSHIGAEDAVVVFGFDEPDRHTKDMASCCRNTGARMIALADSERSAICAYCQHCLFAKAQRQPYGLSLAKPMALVEELLLEVMVEEGERQ